MFLRAGPPPIYIGFGSIVIEDPEEMTSILLSAVRQSGARAIISRGWSKLGGPENLPDVFYLGDCPHEWLFQHVAAVVHHGGAGTTACGLLNGKPTTIVPFFGELVFDFLLCPYLLSLDKANNHDLQSTVLGQHGRRRRGRSKTNPPQIPYRSKPL